MVMFSISCTCSIIAITISVTSRVCGEIYIGSVLNRFLKSTASLQIELLTIDESQYEAVIQILLNAFNLGFVALFVYEQCSCKVDSDYRASADFSAHPVMPSCHRSAVISLIRGVVILAFHKNIILPVQALLRICIRSY